MPAGIGTQTLRENTHRPARLSGYSNFHFHCFEGMGREATGILQDVLECFDCILVIYSLRVKRNMIASENLGCPCDEP